MALEYFPAIYFGFSTTYPESGTRVQLGNSYQFDAAPTAPDQRLFTLRLQGMKYFDPHLTQMFPYTSPDAGRDMAKLEAFYNTHKRAKSFLLNHPLYGEVECKFYAPLQIPEVIPGGGGQLPDFEVQLIEIP